MSKISEIIDHAKEIHKLIEKNDPDEKIEWLSDVYSSADVIETHANNLKYIIENKLKDLIENFVDEVED